MIESSLPVPGKRRPHEKRWSDEKTSSGAPRPDRTGYRRSVHWFSGRSDGSRRTDRQSERSGIWPRYPGGLGTWADRIGAREFKLRRQFDLAQCDAAHCDARFFECQNCIWLRGSHVSTFPALARIACAILAFAATTVCRRCTHRIGALRVRMPQTAMPQGRMGALSTSAKLHRKDESVGRKQVTTGSDRSQARSESAQAAIQRQPSYEASLNSGPAPHSGQARAAIFHSSARSAAKGIRCVSSNLSIPKLARPDCCAAHSRQA
jgi:hypothetical protein